MRRKCPQMPGRSYSKIIIAKMQRASWEQSRGAFLMPGWR
nr:MAG TPA: hypothetical protein [Caudoviricetes sp.]